MDLLSVLIQKNVLDQEKAAALRSRAATESRPVETFIIEENILDEETLFQYKGEALNIPIRNVKGEDIPGSVLDLIPEESAKYYSMVPLKEEKGKLEIGMVYPEDVKAREALQFLARQGNFSYAIVLISPKTFDALMRRKRDAKQEVEQALEELQEDIAKEKKNVPSTAELSRLVEEAPITKMVAVVLRNAVEGKASDIHIEPTKKDLRVRFRFMGQLHASLVLPLKAHAAIVARVKILADMRIDETRIPQGGRFSTTIEGKAIDFRVSTLPTAMGEKVVIRVLDPETGLKDFEQLGLEGVALEKIKEAAKAPYGLLFATGPTGSGKTTTLYAVLRSLNKTNVNIVSLEDPVEYVIQGVNQSQVQPEIGYDFAQGLREILRQDPDIIMVGEVRDAETASLAIHAALTGHLVLSTLHTNNAIGIIPRLVDMGVDRYLLPATLSAGLAQRLVRRLCEECKEEVKPKKAIQGLLDREVASLPEYVRKEMEPQIARGTIFEPKGCDACGTTGYAGRIGVFEVLVMTEELAGIILEKPSEHEIQKEAERQNMLNMRQDGIKKVLEGITTIEEVLRATAENQ
ncbi:MAG: GspE/PulE family protein [Candidatus Yanofskybacteria bacterium]|nr:GspE/PulE family protein [Candidatus Yanofskybacteria bacterium]